MKTRFTETLYPYQNKPELAHYPWRIISKATSSKFGMIPYAFYSEIHSCRKLRTTYYIITTDAPIIRLKPKRDYETLCSCPALTYLWCVYKCTIPLGTGCTRPHQQLGIPAARQEKLRYRLLVPNYPHGRRYGMGQLSGWLMGN